MLLDLGRNDTGKVSNINSVIIFETFNLLKDIHRHYSF